jgi:subfamily B ATP-binding cassette protein HlyB/CyaB
MTQTAAAALRQHPAFQELSEAGWQALEQQVRFLRFRIGQPLCSTDALPSQVLVIVQGQARLLSNSDGQLHTLARMRPGVLVGLASLLRAAPCEYVTAASDVVAASLSDELVLELFQQEESFRRWCTTQLFPAELYALVEQLWATSAKRTVPLLAAFQRSLQESGLLAGDVSVVPQLEPKHQLYLNSANSDLPLGTRLESGADLPTPRAPLPLRLILLPSDLFTAGNTDETTSPSRNGSAALQPSSESSAIETAPELPVASGLRFGGATPLDELKLIRATGTLEETLASFQMMAKAMGLPYRRDALEKTLRDCLRRNLTPNLQLVGQLAASMGLHVMAAKVPASMGVRLQVPSLIPWKGGFALATASDALGLKLASPRDGEIRIKPAELDETFPEGIELLVLDRTNTTPEEKFGVGWFWPALKRYRGVLTQVLVAAFVVQLFTLANPLLIQVIIDKVITQRSLDTLQVLGIALVVVTIMEGVLGSLRTFLFAETTNRIDLRLGAEVIDHLLRLPLSYFDKRPVGDLGTRVAELEKIRSFLTGQALTTILDAAFSVIYIVVMAIYSWVLTLVALMVVPIQVALTLLGAPLFRRQFRQAAQENARTQSHLVEVLTGIQTVKAQNVETVSRWKWQELYSRYIARTFEKTITGTALNEVGQVLQKLSQLLVLWVGAALVLKGELTLGQLIAFRIISGYVTQPLLRLSNIWQNIQELKVSFERLADVVDTPQESSEADQNKIPLPPVEGLVAFDNVSFSFAPGTPPVLKHIDLEITPGTFVGIVGQSGSGKSTLTKLISRLYSPQEGRVLIDHYDIDKVELYSLRRQIGIVPQDPLLFSGSVNDNIALADPDSDSEAIVRAARLACAHEFIMELGSGYSTEVGERGAGLSGGQRQRIAIARTLLANPKLLIMDEATSALDYDTERRVCDNLREALKDCTVFFITHRLSTISRADRIVMMHQGAVVESGTHEELMSLRGRYYALYRQQEAAA